MKNVMKILKKVKDPEIDIDVVSLGLIYNVKVEGKRAKILMTLTSPFCPLGGFLVEKIKKELEKNGYKAEIEVTFDPPWSPDRMSKEAREKLRL